MGFWGPFTALSFALDPTMTNAGENEWIEAQQLNRNPMPINPLKDFGLQTNELPNEAIDTTTPQSYDLLDVMKKSKNPAINYEGLYEDAPSNIATSNIFKAMQPAFEYRNPSFLEHAERKGMVDLAGNVPIDRNRRIDFGRYWSNRPLRATDGVARFEDFNPRVGQPLGYQEAEADQDIDIASLDDPFTNDIFEQNETISTPLDMERDMERFAGVSKLGRNDEDVEQVEYLGNPSKFQNFKDALSQGLGSFRNKAGQGWNFAQELPGMAMSALTGIPFLGQMLGGLGNMFEDRQLTGDVMDEYGNMYSAEDLNKMNAKGGWYTDPARSARRRTSRIANMRQRLEDNKKIRSQKSFDKLVADEQAQQLRDAKDAADRANIQNIQNYTGRELSGYRMSRPASERQFTGGAPKGTTAFDSKSGMGRRGYANGGLATLFTRRG